MEGEENLLRAHEGGKGAILALWHGRMLLPVYYFRKRGVTALVSLHRDGELIARIVEKLGYQARRGSPKEGGMEGFKAMLRDLKEGRIVAIFPDGPTGPRHSLHDGILHLARISGAPIVPMSYCAVPHWRAGSWDKFMVMKLFSRGKVVLHPAFTLPAKIKSDELETYRQQIIDALVAVEQDADKRMNFRDPY
ncbi:lysophospholipid acyltransferase family protein [Calditrichota bacterium]